MNTQTPIHKHGQKDGHAEIHNHLHAITDADMRTFHMPMFSRRYTHKYGHAPVHASHEETITCLACVKIGQYDSSSTHACSHGLPFAYMPYMRGADKGAQWISLCTRNRWSDLDLPSGFISVHLCFMPVTALQRSSLTRAFQVGGHCLWTG